MMFKKAIAIIISIVLTVCSNTVSFADAETAKIDVNKIVQGYEKNTSVLKMTFEKGNETEFNNVASNKATQWMGGNYGSVFNKSSSITTPFKKLEQPIESGLVFINFDFMVPSSETGKLFYVRLMSSPFTAITVENDPYMIETFSMNQGTGDVGIYPNSMGWAAQYFDKFNFGTWQNINMWLDLDLGKIYYCFNNKYTVVSTYNSNELNDFCGIAFSANAQNTYIDNIQITKVSRNTLEEISSSGVNLPNELFQTVFVSTLIGGTGNMVVEKNKSIPAKITLSSIAEEDIDLEAKLKVKDINNVTLYESTQNVTSKAGTEMSFNATLPGVDKYGFYKLYIDLKEKSSEKQICSDSFEFALVNLPEKGTRNSKLGIINHVRHTRMGDPLINLQFIDKAGFSTTRSEVTWAAYEKEKGNYKLTDAYSNAMEAQAENGLGHLEILAYQNALYGNELPPVSDATLEAYANFVC